MTSRSRNTEAYGDVKAQLRLLHDSVLRFCGCDHLAFGTVELNHRFVEVVDVLGLVGVQI